VVDKAKKREPIDVPEADREEQARSWTGEPDDEPRHKIPIDANEADVLDQDLDASFDDENRRQ
jgi:hypothetical protein